MPEGDPALPRVRFPRGNALANRLVEKKKTVFLGYDRERTPEALRPAVERVRRVGSGARTIALEGERAVLLDPQPVQRVALGVREGRGDVYCRFPKSCPKTFPTLLVPPACCAPSYVGS